MSNAFLDVTDSAVAASIVYTKPIAPTAHDPSVQNVLDAIAAAPNGGAVPTAQARCVDPGPWQVSVCSVSRCVVRRGGEWGLFSIFSM